MGSISDAIDAVTEEDVVDDAEETTDETTSEETSEGSLLDEEDEEEAEEADETPDRTVDEAVEGETEEEETDAADIFDQLTPEQLSEIKSNPALNKLRKSLMRDYSTKTTEHSQLVQLGNAYRQDPQGVLRAIAAQLGMEVTPRQAAQAAAAAQAQAATDPGKELEELFGETIGPKVRAVFDKWAEARLGQKLSAEVAPLRDALGRVNSQNEAVRMQGEEVAFKARHKNLAPDVEKEIIALGNSGKIVPGGMSPQEYLETLHDIVIGKRSQQAARQQTGQASTKLAQKIAANRRDREPSGVSGRSGTVKPVSKIGGAKSISEALDLAMAELETEDRR